MKKIFLDSDLFVLDIRYLRDIRAEVNTRFLDKVRQEKIMGVTSIFNILEVCGVLSYNLSTDELINLYEEFTERYRIKVLYPGDSVGNVQYDIPFIFKQIQKKQSLGDAQVSYVVERFASQLSCFVSWNAPHFADKLPIPVKTPAEF